MLASVLAFLMPPAIADQFEDDSESKVWQEMEVEFPPAPSPGGLIPFYVSAVTDNQFFIDGATLSAGSDGVVRYVLVVVSSQGARSVTYEGMRCETRERRVYASGRADGVWSKARRNEWTRIQDASANRHHAALFLEYFCPVGNPVHSAAEARDALLKGGHPDIRRR